MASTNIEANKGNLHKHMQKLNINKKREINVLVLGETGVGKSTFINSFFNYLQNSELKYAMKNKLTTLIPSAFTVTDENYAERRIQVGKDENECEEVGNSATQSCRSYVFPARNGELKVRLIDTPGVGDTRGIEQDNINFENILSFIADLKYLNAICILLKPNNSRLTVMFNFCIKQLLSRLDKSASNNLVFVFTNTRSSFYRPSETLPALRKLLGELQDVKISLDKSNIFCTDNEAFRFMAAYKQGVKFNSMDIDNFADSWRKSAHECKKMILYIAGDSHQKPLKPHDVKNTISVNEARRIIIQLAKPLADIAENINDNIRILDRHKRSLEDKDNTVQTLNEKLYIPIINLRILEMKQPSTVCTSTKCSTAYRVGDKNKWHYHQRCHNPCYLVNVPREIVGSPELLNCAAMGSTRKCKKCNCGFELHMHIYYETEAYEDKLEDQYVKSQICNKEKALSEAKHVLNDIQQRIKELKEEQNIIIKTTATFACFLKTNAIAPYNDAYESYLKYLIDRENSMGDAVDYEIVYQYTRMLTEYNEEKGIIQSAINQSSENVNNLSAYEIIAFVEKLYSLKHNGSRIRNLFAKQKDARQDENKSAIKEFVFEDERLPRRQRTFRTREHSNDSGANDVPLLKTKPNFKPMPQQNTTFPTKTFKDSTGSMNYVNIKENSDGELAVHIGRRSGSRHRIENKKKFTDSESFINQNHHNVANNNPTAGRNTQYKEKPKYNKTFQSKMSPHNQQACYVERPPQYYFHSNYQGSPGYQGSFYDQSPSISKEFMQFQQYHQPPPYNERAFSNNLYFRSNSYNNANPQPQRHQNFLDYNRQRNVQPFNSGYQPYKPKSKVYDALSDGNVKDVKNAEFKKKKISFLCSWTKTQLSI